MITEFQNPETEPSVFILSLKAGGVGIMLTKANHVPQIVEEPSSVSLPAILIKKQGDFPAFWKKEYSFIQVMEEFYQRVKTKNKNLI